MASVVAKNYASALFELAQESNQVELIKTELNTIADTLVSNPDLLTSLTHPSIEKSDKKAILLKVFEGMNRFTSNFIQLLIDQNNFKLLPKINDSFNSLYREANNIEIAEIYSAKALQPSEVQTIKAMLESKTNKTVEVKTFVDESLIAGVKVKLNDIVLDNTILNKMNKLKEEINRQ